MYGESNLVLPVDEPLAEAKRALIGEESRSRALFLGKAVFTLEEFAKALEKEFSPAQDALSTVHPLGDMGGAEVPLRTIRRHTPEQHAKFLATWHLQERGPLETRLERSLRVATALAEAPEILNPQLRFR